MFKCVVVFCLLLSLIIILYCSIDNTMYFEDTFCIYDVIGGDDDDSIYIGQMYNDVRPVACLAC